MNDQREREALAIVALSLFSPLVIAQFAIIGTQVCRSTRSKNPLNYCLTILTNFLVLFLEVRIVGNTLFLEGLFNLIGVRKAAEVLQSFGLAFLLAEQSMLLMMISNRSCGKVIFPIWVQKIIKYLRIPSLTAIALNIIGFIIENRPVLAVAAIVIVCVYTTLCTLATYYGIVYRRHFCGVAQVGFTLILLTLPFLGVRVAYTILSNFNIGNGKYSTVSGSTAFKAAMGLAMEYPIVVLSNFAILLLGSHGKPPIKPRPEIRVEKLNGFGSLDLEHAASQSTYSLPPYESVPVPSYESVHLRLE